MWRLPRELRQRARERRLADDWLMTATGTFVPAKYERRARDLCSLEHRHRLARTLRLIEASALERPIGRRRPLNLTAARQHREAVVALAERLEAALQEVTPAGMLRARALLTDGASPLYGTVMCDELGSEIAVILDLLEPVSRRQVA